MKLNGVLNRLLNRALRMGALLLFLELFLQSEPALSMHSQGAEYKEGSLYLTGSVHLVHDWGKISAEQLHLFPPIKQGGSAHVGRMELEGAITVDLQGGASLGCDRAVIDRENLLGRFYGTASNPIVTLSLPLKKDKEQTREEDHLSVQTHEIEALFLVPDHKNFHHSTPEAFTQPNGKNFCGQALDESSLEKLLLKGPIYANNDARDTLTGDSGIYLPLNHAQDPLRGTLRLMGSPCILSTLSGDKIEAEEILIESSTKRFSFLTARGTLHTVKRKKTDPPLSFIADSLIWEPSMEALVLNGRVQVEAAAGCTLHAPGPVSLARSSGSITSSSQTDLQFKDYSRENSQKIRCPGLLVMQLEKQELSLQGTLEWQLSIENSWGEIYADSALLTYDWKDHKASLRSLQTEGNVRITSRFDLASGSASSVLYYVAADSLNYDPSLHQLILSGTNQRRVLLLDQVHQTQMSAPMLTIQLGKNGEKPSIKGSGNVRFTFMEEEFERLKQHVLGKKNG